MRFRALFASGLVVLAAASVHAQTAGMVSFQGLVRSTATGNPPITTPVSLEFRIFNTDTVGTGSLVDMDGDGTVENTAAAPGAGTDVILVGPLTPNGGIVSTKFGPVSPKAFTGCTPGVAGCRWLEVTVVGSATPLSRLEMVTPPGAAEQVNKPLGTALISQDANGNIGIGTTTPANFFHVRCPTGDSVATFSAPSSQCAVYLGNNQGLNWSYGTGTGQAGNRDFFIGDPNLFPKLVINRDTFNLGIGTTETTSRLNVQQSADTNFSGMRVNNSGNIRSLLMWVDVANRGRIDVGGTADSSLCLNGAGSGNVGIGTTAPATALHVRRAGSIASLVDNSQSSSAIASIAGSTGTAMEYSGSLHLMAASYASVGQGNGTSRMMVDSSGNVGIGTVSPTARLAVQQASDSNAGGLAITNTSVNRSLHAWVDSSSRGRIDVGTAAESPICLNAGGNGMVCIGTTDPTSKLSIRRDDDGRHLSFERAGMESWWVGPIATGDRGLAFANATDGDALRMMLTETGNVGIGTASTSAKLHVAGNIFASGCTGCTSDARFKKNIATVTTALAKLLSLRGVWFQWKDPKAHGDESRRQMGMIAQEVEKVLPEWVIKDKDGYRYLNTNGFPALAVEAIREMKYENDALKNKVSALEDRLARLERVLDDRPSSRRGTAEKVSR